MRLTTLVLTGTLSSGKTTLLDELRMHPLVLVVDEVARELLKDDPKAELDPKLQDRLFEEQIKRESMAQEQAVTEGKRLIILDRGIIDIIAYSEVLGHTVKEEWVRSLNSRYDHIFVFNKDDITNIPELAELGIDIPKYRNDLDLKIREIITRYGFTHTEVYGSHRKRVDIVKGFIKRYLTENRKNRETERLVSQI